MQVIVTYRILIKHKTSHTAEKLCNTQYYLAIMQKARKTAQLSLYKCIHCLYTLPIKHSFLP